MPTADRPDAATAVTETVRPTERIVVVGASMAGLRAAEQLRAAGWTGKITIVGDESHLPYNRPPLSKEALAQAPESTLEDWHATLAFRRRKSIDDAEWLLGVPAQAADLVHQTVTLSDGRTLSYDGLVIATGLRPRRVSPVTPTEGRFVLQNPRRRPEASPAAPRGHTTRRHRGRVHRLRGRLHREVARSRRGHRRADGHPDAARRRQRRRGDIASYHRTRGLRVLTGRGVASFKEGNPGAVAGVVLDDGEELDADVVIESVGSLPNVEWLNGNGLDLSDGVLTNNDLSLPGHPNVVAVGDVARFPNPRNGPQPRRVEHWCMPTDTAKQAARTLVQAMRRPAETDAEPGTPSLEISPTPTFAPLASFWSDQGALRLQSFGSPALADRSRVVGGRLAPEHLEDGVAIEYLAGDTLVGVLLINVQPALHRAHRDAVDAASAAAHPP